MIRLILRRDRVWLPVYVLSIAAFVAGTVATIRELMPTPETRADYAADTYANPVLLLLQGPAYGDSVGALAVQQRGAASMIFAALGSIILLIKHTRGDEEKGRRELLGSAPITRRAPLTAALTVVTSANAALALLIALVCASAGLPVAGSLAWGLMAASGGLFGMGLAALFAQLNEDAGAAGSVAFGLFFLLHIVRGAGDMVRAEWVGWLIPNGWILRAHAFAGELWWVFLPVAACVAVLIVLAYLLSARRDMGAGLVPPRPGPAAASPYGLRGAFGLAWRLDGRAALLWIALATLAALAGGAGGRDAVGQLVRGGTLDEWVARVGTGPPAQIFFELVIYVLAAYGITMYVLIMVLRLREEETRELLLAGPLSRYRWAASHLIIALVTPAGMLLGVGLGLGITTGEYAAMLGITLLLLPAIWVMIGVAAAAYGLFRRAGAIVTWVALAIVLVLELGWEVGVVSTPAFMVTPFAHVHYSVIAAPGLGTFAALTLVAALLIAVGLYGLRRRDLAAQ